MHHTKPKADIGLAKVIADLAGKGHVPCIPLSEHQHYDLVVVMDSGRMLKLQVKYSSLKDNGVVDVKFRTSWTDKQGTHMRHYRRSDFDFYAVYCPEKEIVFYVPNTSDCPKAIRFDRPANKQRKNIRWASDYLNLKMGSSETIRRTPETVKT